ncbi:MAG: hypothetical protein ACRD1X_19375 [Vicinamibacteria bacterium]
MTQMVRGLRALLFPVLLSTFVMGCVGPVPEQDLPVAMDVTPEVEAAVVAGADLVGRIDFEAMRGANILMKLQQAQNDERLRKLRDTNRRFEEVTGLTREDMRFIVFSANTSTVNMSATRAVGLESLDAVVGIALTRPLTIEQLSQGIQAIASERPAPKVTEIEIAGRTALLVEPEGPEQNAAYVALSPESTTVFLAVSKASLAAALTRTDRGEIETPSPSLISAQTVLPRGAQFRLAFVVPNALRSKIRETLDGDQENPQMAMLAGFLQSFKNLQSLSLGIGLSQDMALNLVCDLGSEKSAHEAATMIDTMLAPMMKAALDSAEQPAAIAESFNAVPEGSALKLGLRLTADDLDSIGSRVGNAAAGR